MKKCLPILLFLYVGVLQAQLWQETFDDALQTAKNEKKPIVLVFSGSDWCAPCIRLKKSVFDTEVFTKYAASHYVMYNADFPRRKKNKLPQDKLNVNKSLAERFNSQGHFPLVVVLSDEQKVLGKTGYQPKIAPEEYIASLNRFLR